MSDEAKREKEMTTGSLSEPRLHRLHDVTAAHVERGEAQADAISTKAIGQTVRARLCPLPEKRSRWR